jgi:hypothetical protein
LKVFKRVIAWVLISLLLQATFYLYLDKYYFSDEKNVKITQVNTTVEKKNLKAAVTFPEGVSEIDLSFDGTYTSYFDADKNFDVIKTSSGEAIDIPFSTSAKCIAYKWLPDTNIVLLAEELSTKRGHVVRFYSYDIEKGSKKDIGDPNDKESSIPIYNKNTKIEIEVSTLTGVMYMKFSDDNLSKIYRIDRNETLTRLSTRSDKISTIKVASHDDLLAYEDQETHQIRTTLKKKILKIEESSDLLLLAADGNDNIYIGNDIDGLVNKIFYGELSDEIDSWNSLSLDNAADTKNIYVSYDGGIYLDFENGSLKDLKNSSEITYEGNLIGIYSGIIASDNNGKLTLKGLKT